LPKTLGGKSKYWGKMVLIIDEYMDVSQLLMACEGGRAARICQKLMEPLESKKTWKFLPHERFNVELIAL